MEKSSARPLLTMREFAAQLGISVHTARFWARHRKVATVRLGRGRGCRIQIPTSEVTRIIAQGMTPAAPEVPRV